MEQTTRKIVELAVSGLKREYLSPTEQAKLVNYILDNSTLQVSKTSFNLESASLIGIGKEQADKTLPNNYQFITLFWGDIDPEDTRDDGLPQREWFITSHKSLDAMERLLLSRTEQPGELNNLAEGEVVAIINGNLATYKVEHDSSTNTGSFILNRDYIHWVDLEPYEISYTDSEGLVSLSESYGSLVQTEYRVMQLLRDGAKDVHVRDNLTDKELHFFVSETVYNSSNPKGEKERGLMWRPHGIMDEEDF